MEILTTIKNILNYSFLGNTFIQWILFFLCLSTCLYIIKKFKKNGLTYLKMRCKKNKYTLDDAFIEFIENFGFFFIYGATFYFCFGILNFIPPITRLYNIFGVVLLVGGITLCITELVDWLVKKNIHKKDVKPVIKAALPGFSKIMKIFIWIIACVLFFENLGFHISTLVAGLGIGGIAIAFASQIILKDLFSYISILLDQPFAVGDFIIVNDFMGTIEHIGIKTTRIRSLSGELVIFSNTDLTESRLRNYQHMKERRVVFSIGVVYNTPLEKLKKIPEMIEGIIKNIPSTRFDRAHFFKYAASSLDYEIVYYVLSSDYNQYMNIQQAINFDLKEKFEKQAIEFAYPTQTLFVENKNHD